MSLAAAGRRVVGVHADRGDERPVRDPLGQGVEGVRHPRRRAGNVDDRVPVAVERGPVRRRAVEYDVPRAGGHRAGLTACRAGDVVTARDGVGRDRVGEEQGASENEKSASALQRWWHRCRGSEWASQLFACEWRRACDL